MPGLTSTSGKPPRKHPFTDASSLRRVFRESFLNLNPARLIHNPVMLAVEVGAILVSVFSLRDLILISRDIRFDLQVAFWLWMTVWVGNFAKALATARGLAHADALRRSRSEFTAKRLIGKRKVEIVPASKLRIGDIVRCEAGDLIPADGEIIEGIAVVDESAITGESASVIRESGGDRSTVSAGTRILSDQVKIRITAGRGETFLERRIGLVEALERRSFSTEGSFHRVLGITTIGLVLLLAALTPALMHLLPELGRSAPDTALLLVPLLVCLLPTPIAALLSAINISAADRILREGILPSSGKAIETSARLHRVLFDKTGTVTIGNREAIAMLPCDGISEVELARTAYLCSFADDTPEGRSILRLTQEIVGSAEPITVPDKAMFVPFSAYTRMSGADIGERSLRKGAMEAIGSWVRLQGGAIPPEGVSVAEGIARDGGTPLAVADDSRVLGIIHLKDVLRTGVKECMLPFSQLGIRTILITGDNPVTAGAIARDIGIGEVIAEYTAADKLAYIKAEQRKRHLIGMVGDGANDAPALAQADIGMSLSGGSAAAREASNLVDLRDAPGRLYRVVLAARQLISTRDAIGIFSIVSSVTKFLLVVPAIFMAAAPALASWNLIGLKSSRSAILSAAAMNALFLLALIPTAFWGVRYQPRQSNPLIGRSVMLYAVLGFVGPIVCMWLMGRAFAALHLL